MEADSTGRFAARRLALSIATVAGCVAGVGALLPPAVGATTAPTAAAGRPSVALEGLLATSGLPGSPATSALVVRNTGDVPVRWTVRTRLEGTGTSSTRMDVLTPVGDSCTAPGRPVSGWSSDALEPGATATVCVRISVDGSAAGVVTPTVTVDARQA